MTEKAERIKGLWQGATLREDRLADWWKRVVGRYNAFEPGGAVERLLNHTTMRKAIEEYCDGCAAILAELEALLPERGKE